MNKQKIIYISGPITGISRYWEAFERAEDLLTASGFVAISPARLPSGMSHKDYMHICKAMIDRSDAVLLLQGWGRSDGCREEVCYCYEHNIPVATSYEGLYDALLWRGKA